MTEQLMTTVRYLMALIFSKMSNNSKISKHLLSRHTVNGLSPCGEHEHEIFNAVMKNTHFEEKFENHAL